MAVGAGLAVACFAAFERRFGPEAQAPAAAAVAVQAVVTQPVSVPVVAPVVAAPVVVSPAPPTVAAPTVVATPMAANVTAQGASPAAAPKRGQIVNFGAADGLKVDATPAPSPVRRTFRKADKPKPETPSDVLASALGTSASPEPPPPPPPVAETPLAVQLAPEAPVAPPKAKSAADVLAEAQLRAPMK